MKIMVTSFRRSHACTATLTAPDPAAGPHQPTPPLETPGHSQTSLGQSLVGSVLLSPGSWCTQDSVCALLESFSQSCVRSGSCMVGLRVTYAKSEVKVTQSCPTLCDAMDYTVHGILQARILEWVAFYFSRVSSQPRDPTQVSCIAGRFFTS